MYTDYHAHANVYGLHAHVYMGPYTHYHAHTIVYTNAMNVANYLQMFIFSFTESDIIWFIMIHKCIESIYRRSICSFKILSIEPTTHSAHDNKGNPDLFYRHISEMP